MTFEELSILNPPFLLETNETKYGFFYVENITKDVVCGISLINSLSTKKNFFVLKKEITKIGWNDEGFIFYTYNPSSRFRDMLKILFQEEKMKYTEYKRT